MGVIHLTKQSALWVGELLFAVQLPLFIFAISFSGGNFEVLGQSVGSYLTGQFIMIIKALGLLVPLALFLKLLILRQFDLNESSEIIRNHSYIIIFIILSGLLLLTAVKPQFSFFKWVILISSYSALFALLCQYKHRYGDLARHHLYKHLLFAFSLCLLFPYFAIMQFGPSVFFAYPRQLIGLGIAHPNLLSAFFCYGLYFAIFYNSLQGYNTKKNPPSGAEYIVRVAVVILFLPLILIANSRGVYMAMLFGMGASFVIWFFVRQSLSMYLFTAIALLVALFLAIGIAAGWIPTESLLSSISRYEDGSDLTSLTGRTDIWDAALKTNNWRSYLLGNGYAVMMPELAFKLETGTLYGTHNTPMMVLFATGIGGLLAYLMFYAQNIMRIPIILRHDGIKHAGFFIVALTTFAIHQNVETFFGLNLDGIFSLFLLFFAFDTEIHDGSSLD